MKNRVLLDADYIAYKNTVGKDDLPLEEVIEKLDEDIRYILATCKDAFNWQELWYISFLGGKINNRKVEYPDYKSNRKQPIPKHLPAIRLHILAFWNGFEVNGIESDDAIGICAHYLPTTHTIICTADKDFAQMKDIWVYDIYPRRAECKRKDVYIDKELTDDGVWYKTSKESALKQLTYQLIYGDSGDGVKGIPSFGGKKRGHKKAALEAAMLEIGDKWYFDMVVDVVHHIYHDQLGSKEGERLFKKVFKLVYIEEFYCTEFKEIPKMVSY